MKDQLQFQYIYEINMPNPMKKNEVQYVFDIIKLLFVPDYSSGGFDKYYYPITLKETFNVCEKMKKISNSGVLPGFDLDRYEESAPSHLIIAHICVD